MGYKYNGSPLKTGVAWTDTEGTQYPASWLGTSTPEQRAAVPSGGVTWEIDVPTADVRFFYRSGSPKPIADLKAYWIEEQKNVANRLLAQTDWLVIRKAEAGTAIPSDTTTYRTAVRTQSKAREDQITACSDTDALAKLINQPSYIEGDSTNGATEVKKEKFDTSKEVKDSMGNSYNPKQYESFDPKQYESYDPKRYEKVPNPDRLKDWPTTS